MKHSRTVFAGLLASTFLAGAALADSHATHPVTGEALAADQTFVYRVLDESPSIDPQKVEDVDGSHIARDLFEGLINQDEKGNAVAGVATEWSSSDDQKTWTFKLRDNAKWSNGDPVLAGDFVYGWQRAVDPATASPYAWYMELTGVANGAEIIAGDVPVEELGIKAIDDLTLEVSLSKPVPFFPQMLSHATTFPAHRATIEAHGDDWTKPENMVSNGAYVLSERVPGEKLVRSRNEMYWDNENTIIDQTVLLVINDETQALTRYLSDELDWTLVPAGQFPKLKAERPDEATSVPELCSYYYHINHSESGREEFKDVRVREALSLAIDREVIVEKVTAGGQVAAYNFTPGATAGFEIPELPVAAMSQSDRDAKAKMLLEEAGFGPGNPLTFDLVYNTSEAHKKVAIAISQMWKQKLGVEVGLANQEWKTFLETRGNQNFDLARGGWCGDYNEASTFLDLYRSASSYNDGKYSNAKIDDLMDQAVTESDPSEIYREVERIAADDVAIIPIYHYTNAFMLDPQVEGWPYENVQQSWYSKDLYKTAE